MKVPIAGPGAGLYDLTVNARRKPFWDTQPGIIRSNSCASDWAHIRATLLRPRFGQLLEIGLEFGVDRLREEWRIPQADPSVNPDRVRPAVERILSHIEEGFARALARH